MMMMNKTLHITPVRTRRQREQFIRLPWRLYHGDSCWVPPLLVERRRHLDPRHNPFFHHAEVDTWLATAAGLPVGRISAQVDHLHQERYGDGAGFFGHIDAVDDPAVFAALLETAGDWLRERGMRTVRGPFNFSINQECGLLVDGFDSPPMVMMGHAPSWYAARLEEQGLAKAMDMLAWRVNADFTPPAFLTRMAPRLAGRVRLRPLDNRRFDAELDLIREIFEDAWQDNWGFVPFTAEELDELGRNLKFLVPPELVRFAEVDGEPAAMMVVFPNVNEAIRDLDGRLLPLGWLRLLWRLKVSGVKTIRVPLMGVRRRLQNSRLGAALALMLITSLQEESLRRGVETAEMSWILENNEGMSHINEAIGGVPYKRYRIYAKELP
ncbi:MAG: N-acetyltransferase [Deltaproteobacteria bacterium]|nr:N-acetyltransferase [Candidatus Anaeroferrophillacea bacterium]